MTSKQLENMIVRWITDHKEDVYRLAYSYVKNAEDALDVVQDSIHKALTSTASLKDPQAVKSWFYRIVVNTSLDFLRRRKRVHIADEETLELYSSGVDDVYQDIDLKLAIEELPVKYRSIIILKFIEDLTLEEVAHVLDENVNTVKTRLYRALKLLRITMDDSSKQEV